MRRKKEGKLDQNPNKKVHYMYKKFAHETSIQNNDPAIQLNGFKH